MTGNQAARASGGAISTSGGGVEEGWSGTIREKMEIHSQEIRIEDKKTKGEEGCLGIECFGCREKHSMSQDGVL